MKVTDIDGIAVPDSCPNAVIITPTGSMAESVAKDMGLTVRNFDYDEKAILH